MSYEAIIYSIWTIACVILAVIMVKVLKRNPKSKINQLFAIAIFCAIFGLFIDLIKNPMIDPSLVPLATLLNLFSLYFACLGMVFFLLILLMLYKPEVMNNRKNQALVCLLYGLLLAIIFLIPNGITLEAQPENIYLVSVYSLPLTIYVVSLLSFSIITTLYLYKPIYKKFKDPEVIKRFRCFILGTLLLCYSPIGVCVVNYLNIPTVRVFFSYSLFLIFIGLFLVYYGIGTGFKKE